MNLMYLPTKGELYQGEIDISLALAALFITKESEQSFLENSHNISFKNLITRVEDVSSIPQEFHKKNFLDVLLVEVDVNMKEDLQCLRTLLETDFKNIPIIVTVKDITLNMTRELMYMGVVDVLPQPFVEGDIITVLERASEKNIWQDVPGANGKIISFIKGGGGVGATTLAVQSGCFLSRKLDDHDMSVSLLDLDIQFGTAGLYLDIQNDDGLLSILAASDRMDGALLQGVFNKHETTGLNVLTIPREVVPMDVISEEVILRTLKILRQDHKFTILDMPSTWTSWSATVLKHSDMIILVTEISISAISKAKRQLDTLKAQGLGSIPVRVVVNRFTDKTEKMFSISDVENVLDRSIDYKIPNDYKLVSNAENNGVPLVKIIPNSKVDKSIRALISDVVGELTNSEIQDFLAEHSPSFLERIGLRHVFTKK